MVFNRRKIVLAIIGERGVMKIKIFGFAAMLSLAALLGACDGGGGGTSEPGATTSPAAGEPADGGAMMSPSPGGAMMSPSAPTSPSATTSPAATPSATKSP
jgi:hypothetical protein